MKILIRLPISLTKQLGKGRDPQIQVVADGELVTLLVPAPGERSLGEGVLPAGLVERCELEVHLPGDYGGPPFEVYVAPRPPRPCAGSSRASRCCGSAPAPRSPPAIRRPGRWSRR